MATLLDTPWVNPKKMLKRIVFSSTNGKDLRMVRLERLISTEGAEAYLPETYKEMVPEERLELSQGCPYWILSQKLVVYLVLLIS